MLAKIKYPLILDGGLSNVLEGFGCDLNNELWSASLLINQPDLIKQAHLKYLTAGAKCISTSSYQASIEGFAKYGFTQEESEKLMLGSIDLALEAKTTYLEQNTTDQAIYIAASMGPYGAVLADGSEYRGNYSISEKALKEFHLQRIRLFETTEVDFFGFETIPSLLEVKVLSELLLSSTKPSWISFSCKDGSHLNDGNKIYEAAKLIADVDTVFALGVNCTSPKYISAIIEVLKESAPQKKIIVYPNSGEVYHVESKSWLGVSNPYSFEKMALEWRKNGADIIGGCCRIGPEHIEKIRDLI